MPKRQRKKNPAAVALGRLGGLRRAQTVMDTIPAEKRREYSQHALDVRWADVRAKKAQKLAALGGQFPTTTPARRRRSPKKATDDR